MKRLAIAAVPILFIAAFGVACVREVRELVVVTATPAGTPTLTAEELAYVEAVATQQALATVAAEQTKAARPTSTPRPPPTAKPLAYELALLGLDCVSMAGYGHAEGVIKNSGRSELSHLQPSVVFRDGSGHVVGSGSGWVNIVTLAPGQETPFVAQTLYPIGNFARCSVQFQGIVGGFDAYDISQGRFPETVTIPLVDAR